MPPSARQQKRMKPYTRLPDPPESDGKPGGDDELGSSGLPDPSVAASSKGGQSGRGARAATNEEQIKAQEAGQIKYRRKKMRDEAPPHRKDEIIVVV